MTGTTQPLALRSPEIRFAISDSLPSGANVREPTEMQLLDELLKFVGATGCSDLRRVAAVMNFVKIPNVPGDESIDRILTHTEVLLLCRRASQVQVLPNPIHSRLHCLIHRNRLAPFPAGFPRPFVGGIQSHFAAQPRNRAGEIPCRSQKSKRLIFY